MNGDLDEFIDELAQSDQAERLQAIGAEAGMGFRSGSPQALKMYTAAVCRESCS